MLFTLRFIAVVCVAEAFLASATARRTSRGGTCRLTRTQAEKCASAVIIFGSRDVHFPSDMEEGATFCSTIDDGIKCLSTYKYCMQGFKRSLLHAFVSFMNIEAKGVCNEVVLPRFIKQTPCLDRASERSNDFFKCTDRYVLMVDYVLEKVSSEDKFPALCCANSYYRQCMRRFTDEFCSHLVNGEVPRYLDNVWARAAKILSPCSAKYNSPNSCAVSMTAISKKFAEISSDYDVRPQNRTFLLSLLDIFDN